MLVRWTNISAGAPPPAHLVHSVCTPCTPCVHRVRLPPADPHLRFVQHALRCARQVSLENKYVLQAIFYLSMKKQAAEEAWLARGAPWKLGRSRTELRNLVVGVKKPPKILRFG